MQSQAIKPLRRAQRAFAAADSADCIHGNSCLRQNFPGSETPPFQVIGTLQQTLKDNLKIK